MLDLAGLVAEPWLPLDGIVGGLWALPVYPLAITNFRQVTGVL
jgi:hypothetical protein